LKKIKENILPQGFAEVTMDLAPKLFRNGRKFGKTYRKCFADILQHNPDQLSEEQQNNTF